MIKYPKSRRMVCFELYVYFSGLSTEEKWCQDTMVLVNIFRFNKDVSMVVGFRE